MSASIGKNGVLKLDNTSGTPVDLSNEQLDNKQNRTQESLDTTVIGGSSRSKTSIPGLLESDFQVELLANSTTRSLVNALYAAGYTGTIEIGPDGSTTGNVRYRTEAFITKVSEDVAPGGVKKLSVTLQGTGDVSIDTY
jgi:hypothetical protein